MFFLHGMKRTNAVGWICAAFNLSVFASPLSIMVLTLRLYPYFHFDSRIQQNLQIQPTLYQPLPVYQL